MSAVDQGVPSSNHEPLSERGGASTPAAVSPDEGMSSADDVARRLVLAARQRIVSRARRHPVFAPPETVSNRRGGA
jgi:hypothetical protein